MEETKNIVLASVHSICLSQIPQNAHHPTEIQDDWQIRLNSSFPVETSAISSPFIQSTRMDLIHL